jgi:hypothetical protein
VSLCDSLSLSLSLSLFWCGFGFAAPRTKQSCIGRRRVRNCCLGLTDILLLHQRERERERNPNRVLQNLCKQKSAAAGGGRGGGIILLFVVVVVGASQHSWL